MATYRIGDIPRHSGGWGLSSGCLRFAGVSALPGKLRGLLGRGRRRRFPSPFLVAGGSPGGGAAFAPGN